MLSIEKEMAEIKGTNSKSHSDAWDRNIKFCLSVVQDYESNIGPDTC